MEVYVEYVMLDNLIINCIIIVLVEELLGDRYNRFNLWLSVIFGTVMAIVFPLLKIRNLYLIFLKILVGIIMALILKKYAIFRRFLTTCIVLFIMTFLMGGVCYGINQILGLETSIRQLIIGGFEFPISIFVLVSAMIFWIVKKLIIYLKHKCRLTNFYFDVTIKQGDKKYDLRGFLDTGNKLVDGENPVVVIPKKTFLKVFKDFPFEKIPLGKAPYNPHYLEVGSVGKKSKVLVIEIDEIYIKNNEKSGVFKNVNLAISNANFSSDFDILLHSSF